MIIIAVTGGRKYSDRSKVFKTLDMIYGRYNGDIKIVHGGATGLDTLADMWARRNKVPFSAYHANWTRYGKAAGPIRNQEIIDSELPSLLLAFPGGSGTNDMISRAEIAGIKVERIV